jgi:heme-degrading monooxygenase HmoA
MAVIMNTEVPGADATFMDGMRAAGVVDAITKAPGFVSHVSGVSASGYRVIEVWDSREAHQAWFDNHIAPNLPPGFEPAWEYTDLVIAVPDTGD